MKYLDINSAYRNRTLFPNPANFQVYNQINNIKVITDPISQASILYPTPNAQNTYAYPISQPHPNQLILDPLVYYPYGGVNTTPVDSRVAFTDAFPAAAQNIFNGNTLEVFNDDPAVNGGLITSTFYSITDTVYGAEAIVVEITTIAAAIDTTVDVYPNPLLNFFLSLTSSNIDGYYIGKTIIVGTNTFRNIIGYDGGNRLATVDVDLAAAPTAGTVYSISSPTTQTVITNTNITPTGTLTYPSNIIGSATSRNLYRIRNGMPAFQGTAAAGSTARTIVSLGALPMSLASMIAGKWLVITNTSRQLTAPQPLSAVVFPTHGYKEFSLAEPTLVTVVSTAGVNPLTDHLVVQVGTALLILTIQSIINATQLYVNTGTPIAYAAADPYWFVGPNPLANARMEIATYNAGTITLVEPFSSAVAVGDFFDILTITSDNYSPLITTIAPFQPVCYNVALHSLMLPNLPVSDGYGNTLTFYPYLYVEFSSTLAPEYSNIFSTNVPQLTQRLFKVPMFNIVDPSADFVVLNGLGMNQSIKLKIYDCFRVTVYLPNGQVLEYDIADTMPPNLPLSKLQTSFTFELSRDNKEPAPKKKAPVAAAISVPVPATAAEVLPTALSTSIYIP